MKRETLFSVKEDLRKFHGLVSSVTDFWVNNFDHYRTMQVVLQNMGFEGRDCHNYDFKADLEKFHKGVKVLKNFSDYYNSHVENWIYYEVSMIIEGYEMSELEAEQSETEYESGVYSKQLTPEQVEEYRKG